MNAYQCPSEADHRWCFCPSLYTQNSVLALYWLPIENRKMTKGSFLPFGVLYRRLLLSTLPLTVVLL